LHGTYHRLAVIGLMYELDDECNQFLDYFWDAFPNEKGTADYAGPAADFNAKLSDELEQGYYHWFGSLTTPPCTEGVSWNLIKKPQKVCQRQVNVLKQALGRTQDGIAFNNRVPQPLNHRVVVDSTRTNLVPAPAPASVPAGTRWVYANAGQTEANRAAQENTWGGLCSTGKEQSPIDIVTKDAVLAGSPGSAPLPKSESVEPHFNAELLYVKNTGHGLQLFETSPAVHGMNRTSGEVQALTNGKTKGYSMINGAKYNFYQVHWHAPSENTINGKSFAMEAHFVHQLDDVSLHGTYHRLAVIGLLYELGDECNPFLDHFWNNFPKKKGVEGYSGPDLDFNQKLQTELAAGYYHWYGSLTTPPCTEGVSWNLLRQVETVCQRQLDVLLESLGSTQQGQRFNNRVTQPLNHRRVMRIAANAITSGAGVWSLIAVGLLA